MTTLFGSVLPMPLPAHPDPDLLDLWRRYAPASPEAHRPLEVEPDEELLRALLARETDGDGDFEDWTEMAARLQALLHSGADELWLSWGKCTGVFEQHLPCTDGTLKPTGSTVTLDEAVALLGAPATRTDRILHYGPLQESSPLKFHGVTNRAPDRYVEHAAFSGLAGRPTLLTGIDDSDEPLPSGSALQDVMAEWAHDGIDRVFIKGRRPKSGVWTVPTSTDRDKNTTNLFDAMDWDLVRFSGLPDFFITQPWVPMGFEYRVFVAHGRPVTGSGCIESLTPLAWRHEQDGSPFAPFVEEVRGDGNILRRPDIARAAVACATEAADRIGTDFGDGYVVDVALINDAWHVIEFNAVDNAGLYASNPTLFTRALVAGLR